MDREQVITLAREAGLFIPEAGIPDSGALMRFAALVADYLRSTDIHSCHPNCQRPMCVAVRAAVAAEREACAKVADLVAREIDDTNGTATYIAQAIRSRT